MCLKNLKPLKNRFKPKLLRQKQKSNSNSIKNDKLDNSLKRFVVAP